TRYLVTDRDADYVLTVKANQPGIHAALDNLSWHDLPSHTSINTGHGRTERRTIRVQPAPAEIDFPHAAQAFLVERYVTDTQTGTTSAIAEPGLTSLGQTAQKPHAPGRVTAYLRGHWRIENKLHYVRDVTYHEDASRVRARNAPRIMA